MNYFEERVLSVLKDDSDVVIDKKRAIPEIYRLAGDLREVLKTRPDISSRFHVRFFRTPERRSLVVFRFKDADSYLVLKHFSKNTAMGRKMPLQVLAVKGREGFLVLEVLARRLHSIFDNLDVYCERLYGALHLNYLFDASMMTGTFLFDKSFGEENFEDYGEETFGGIRF